MTTKMAMTDETRQFAEKILRATKNRDQNEAFPVKIGELRCLCEALVAIRPFRPLLSDKQQIVYDKIKINPGATAEQLAKELGYSRALPLMHLLSGLIEKGYVKPVATERDPVEAI